MRRFLLTGAALAMIASVPLTASAACPDFDHEHAAWTSIVSKHVSADKGLVDYDAIIKEDKSALTDYIKSLESCAKSDFDAWNKNDQMAVLINSYNAYTIKTIVDNYPIKSIRAIGFVPGAIFRKKQLNLKVLGKGPVALDTIEHENLRPKYKDPRVHFAVNCASASCPQLRNEAFTGAKLDEQLDEMGRIFMTDKSKNRLKGDVAELSMIYKWFAEDFKDAGGAAKFGAQFAEGDFKAALESNPKIEYLTYDWSLNKQ